MTSSSPHEELFTSGAYLPLFQPEAAANPFARIYAEKRELVLSEVQGVDQRVLDVGGGMGRIAIPLSQRHFVTLSDISSQMLEQARHASGPRLKLVQADASNLPFGEGSFDCVVCIDLLPHLVAPAATLREFRRVLRPRGTLIIDSTNAVPLWTLAYPRYLGRNPLRWVSTWLHRGVPPEWQGRIWHLRRRCFLTLVREAGFRVDRVRGIGPAMAAKWHLATATAL